ncbi:carboxy-S-adenosyl-L-methionine synthase CmoA [Helicobacter sp. 16-1353]|uniref:carboxy-S-adenosyl-L-methionine synthase CmoA n=1 Tax=Helicobacter sp. 16-1353 TaxID=2004996 RepID=UPI000DCAEC6B|nr:carboxy-S-adenosyl-L-methionine synthase CmoA [Helicobacter sp. 16-1353]RAX53057.1 carboxy-S-adenosyl-L-methionine synthase CmoA [Helicobacter sp. 16-1353]
MKKDIKIDTIFQKEINKKFTFDDEVASVFDDMAIRSIPYYKDNIDLIVKILSKRNYKSICDMGCSTGNLLLSLARKFKNIHLVGIDNSPSMLQVARSKASAYGLNVTFIQADILDYEFDFDAIISNYTLQFVRPINRESLLSKIQQSLPKNGILILSEKLISQNKQLDKELIDIYHSFKQEHGYSNTEISKKREALENILVPYTQDENVDLLKKAGFKSVEVVFRFANFATFIAMKD